MKKAFELNVATMRRRSALAAGAWALAFAGMGAAQAENLDAGKSAAQLFSSNCSVCHSSVRGLAKGQAGSGLQGFLRQHYTTGVDMAKLLANYVNANGGSGSARLGGAPANAGAAPSVPRQVDLPPRRPGPGDVADKPASASDAKASAQAKAESGKAKADQKPDQAKADGAAPAEKKNLPLAAELAASRPAPAAAAAAIAVARPLEAQPVEAKPAESKPAESPSDAKKPADGK